MEIPWNLLEEILLWYLNFLNALILHLQYKYRYVKFTRSLLYSFGLVNCLQRGTVELKKYLCSRIEDPQPIEPTNKGIQNGGDTGIVGGSGEGLKAHDIHQSKSLDYRYLPAVIW